MTITTEPLRDLEIHFKKNHQLLTEIKTSTDLKLNKLDWMDNGYRKLEEQYRQNIQDIIQTSDEFTSFLKKKADLFEQVGNF